ncbi:hypothetical protein BU16DRAFT_559820 [Lophium mytilinum]|uniref:Uncharacterized protein n=1 Tax=Lophium mytilinum TaxID=390894 RepID=A0A6A6R069_9PEZI|nr:hypothetical protein BU16DRAFT_559820 [Lophium mytilinum]
MRPSLTIPLLFAARSVSWGFTSGDSLARQHVLSDEALVADHALPDVIPGGSPFSYCNQSRQTDLYNISMINFNPQPLYLDRGFGVSIYGTYLKDVGLKATFEMTGDCGSHCKEYGYNHTAGETESWGFCPFHNDTQQLDKKGGCPPVEDFALTSLAGWVMPRYCVPACYNFTFDAKTADGERIYCLTAEVCLRWEDEKMNKWYVDHGSPGANCTWPR